MRLDRSVFVEVGIFSMGVSLDLLVPERCSSRIVIRSTANLTNGTKRLRSPKRMGTDFLRMNQWGPTKYKQISPHEENL